MAGNSNKKGSNWLLTNSNNVKWIYPQYYLHGCILRVVFYALWARFKCKNVIVVIMSACWSGRRIEPSRSVGPPKHISPCYAQFGVFIIAIETPFLVRTQAFIWYTPHESNDPCNQVSAKNSSSIEINLQKLSCYGIIQHTCNVNDTQWNV